MTATPRGRRCRRRQRGSAGRRAGFGPTRRRRSCASSRARSRASPESLRVRARSWRTICRCCARRRPAPHASTQPRRRLAIAVALLVAIGAIGAAGMDVAAVLARQRGRAPWRFRRSRGTADNGDFDAGVSPRARRPFRHHSRRSAAAAALGQCVADDASPKRSARRRSRHQRLSSQRPTGFRLGVTPLSRKVPFGRFAGAITKPGYEPLEVSGAGHEVSTVSLVPASERRSPDGVRAARGVSTSIPGPWTCPNTGSTSTKSPIASSNNSSMPVAIAHRDFWREPFVKDGRDDRLGRRRSRSFTTRRAGPVHRPGRLARIRMDRTTIPSAA